MCVSVLIFVHYSSVVKFKFHILLSEFRIALIQLLVGSDKLENLKHANQLIEISAKNNANLVVLPVMKKH